MAKACREDSAFAEFYALYPRKEDPDDALKAYRQVIRKGATHAEIMAGLSRYRFSDDPQYIKHPAGWLRAGSWKSEPLPPSKPKEREPTGIGAHEQIRREYELPTFLGPRQCRDDDDTQPVSFLQ
jgi:hypothetical protein